MKKETKKITAKKKTVKNTSPKKVDDVIPVGFIPEASPKLWGLCGESGSVLSGVSRMPISDDMNWGPLLPEDEFQHIDSFDSFSCVTFSALNDLEVAFNIALGSKEISLDSLKWLNEKGYIKNNKINFSDSFTAVASGTTKSGNTIENVGNSIRKIGVIPESVRPFTNTWEKFHRPITDDEVKFANEFRDKFLVEYEWKNIRTNGKMDYELVRKVLAYGPFQTAGLICSGWSWDDTVKGCGLGGQHAFLVYGIDKDNNLYVYDTYKKIHKKLAPGYDLACAVQYFIAEKKPEHNDKKEVSSIIGYDFTKKDYPHIEYGNDKNSDSWLVHNLQMALQYLGYMKKGVFGKFGPQTRDALARFQEDVGIYNDNGMHFGPKTKKALTKALKPKVSTGKKIKAGVAKVTTSSVDKDSISLTIKGLLVALGPVIIHYTGWSDNELGMAIESIMIMISTAMTLVGLVRKIVNRKWSASDK